MGLFIATALTGAAPRQAEAQGAVEYALILILAGDVEQNPAPFPSGAVLMDLYGARFDDLVDAVNDFAAGSDGEKADDAARRLLGPAHALRGAYNACHLVECDMAAELLDTVIDGLEAVLDRPGGSGPSPDP